MEVTRQDNDLPIGPAPEWYAHRLQHTSLRARPHLAGDVDQLGVGQAHGVSPSSSRLLDLRDGGMCDLIHHLQCVGCVKRRLSKIHRVMRLTCLRSLF